MARLQLSIACWNYDRTRALLDERVRPDGIDLTYLNLPVEETFFRMLRRREFDVAEMSLSSYVMSLFSDARPFVAIPVFPSRFFRHSCIYVNAASGIARPSDLVGRRVGTPEYQMTAPVWIRGILADEYPAPLDSVTYATGGQRAPGRAGAAKADAPGAPRAGRGPPPRDGGRLLALRAAAQPRNARHISPLLPRPGTLAARPRSGGSLRARNARVLQDLTGL